MKRTNMWLPGLLLLLLLSACGSEIETPGEELRLLSTQLEPAYLNEPYSADIPVVGGLAPYSYELSEGELPPGLSLQGNTIRGTPTEEGRYTFTVTVSDANLSKTFEEFTLNVTEPPPAELVLNVPETEMQGPFFIRGEIANARELQAFRSSISWDPQRFELVPGTLRATRSGLALFHNAGEGNLNVDVAVLSGSLNGEHNVFEFQLRPVTEPSTILITARTEFLSAGGDHAFATLRDGTEPGEPAQDQTPDEETGPESDGQQGAAEDDGTGEETDEPGAPNDDETNEGGNQ